MSSDSSQNEISLEDLVGEVDGKVSDPSGSVGAAQTGEKKDAPSSTGSNVSGDLDAINSADVDSLLAEEDPTFASSMAELQKQGSLITPETDIDPLDLELLAKEKVPGRLRMILAWLIHPGEKATGKQRNLRGVILGIPLFLISAVRIGLLFFKNYFLGLLKSIRLGFTEFLKLPGKKKLIFFGGISFGVLALITLKVTIGDRMNPFLVGTKFLKSFSDAADAKYTFDEHDPIDDFTDPLFHPEHVVMFDKFVVNLRRPIDGSNPMGLFEFYFEASNQDCAVELKDREGESRDVISRAIEQMSYNELATGEGKEKLKVILRKAVNSILTRGQVRRVFFKTVVLKP